MNTSLEVKREDRVLRLTLNRPEKRNALSAELCQAIVSAIEESQADDAVGSILIDSTGEVFCAGMDLEEAVKPNPPDLGVVHERLFTLRWWARKPVVAAVKGSALGGGVGLLANAHIVVAAHGSSFGLTEIRVGMWPFLIYRSIESAFGSRRALELALTGRIFNVPEAVQWGLVSEAVPPIELDDRTFAIAAHLASASPRVLAEGLAFVAETRNQDLVLAGATAAKYRSLIFASSDFREGVAALREKRRPVWPSTLAGD